MKFNFLPKPMSGFVKVLLWFSVACHLLIGPWMVYYGKVSLHSYVIALLMDLLIISCCLGSKKGGSDNA
jgi:hypothetical protein